MRRFNLKKQIALLSIGGLLTLGLPIQSGLGSPQVDSARQSLPGRRISGGSRSPNAACLANPDQPVIALMPKNNLGLTVAEHPTLWFSLPAVSPDRILEFGLYDPSGELLYTKTFSPPGNAEVASLPLPDSFSPLVVDKDYRWYLSVVCNPESRAEDLVVTGWIRRVAPSHSVNEQLAFATAKERIALYEESALWYDTLTTLAELRRTSPTAILLEQQWVSLLELIDLPQVISAPLGNPLMPTPPIAQSQPLSP
ncbi:MAG: DUF928 domain-containing protein [Phormidesmis sp.]